MLPLCQIDRVMMNIEAIEQQIEQKKGKTKWISKLFNNFVYSWNVTWKQHQLQIPSADQIPVYLANIILSVKYRSAPGETNEACTQKLRYILLTKSLKLYADIVHC